MADGGVAGGPGTGKIGEKEEKVQDGEDTEWKYTQYSVDHRKRPWVVNYVSPLQLSTEMISFPLHCSGVYFTDFLLIGKNRYYQLGVGRVGYVK